MLETNTFSFIPRFVEKYGTHVIAGIKMGGKDVIYIKQHQDSVLQQCEVQNLLKRLANETFAGDSTGNFMPGAGELQRKLNVSIENSISHPNMDSKCKILAR